MRLGAGDELDIAFVDGRLEIEVPARDFRIERRGRISVAVADEPMPALTAETVREVLDEVRR